MLNVSRTPVPESWLSTLATKPSVGYNSLDKEAFVTLEKGRFSISTIDSELLPELVAWSTLMNAMPHSCAQSIPSDITKPDGTDTVHGSVTTHEANSTLETNMIHEADTVDEANPLLSSILDPTTLEVGFDQSCFDALDELLILDPFEAFLDACWLDAIEHNGSIHVTTPTQSLTKPAGRRKLPPLPVTSQKPEQRDGHVGQTLTHHKEELPTSPSAIRIEVTPTATQLPEQKQPWLKRDPRFSTFSDDDKATSFIIFQAPALTPNRYDSIGHFPMPSTRPHRNAVSRRVPTFCTNLPAAFTHVR